MPDKVEIEIREKEVLNRLKRLIRKGENLKPVFHLIGTTIIKPSIQINFKRGGRPKKWEKSQRALREGGQTLRQSGALVGSVSIKSFTDRVIAFTNKIYAWIHQEGFKGVVRVPSHSRISKKGKVHTVKSHSKKMNIPQRKFMIIQDEDREEAEKVIRSYLLQD